VSGPLPAARRIAAGRPEDTAAGEVRVLPLPPDSSGVPREALLLRDEAGVLRAYLNRCRHLPTTLDAAGRKFFSADRRHLQCQTHGALYRLNDGYCVEGPCEGSTLYRLELEVEGDTLYITLE
jgi:nitrite reductase/ring-hydroxylating ferredoxin subunit